MAFKEQSDAFRRVLASAEDPSPSGDIALIFNYMKTLDPRSTVREGEVQQLGQAGNLPTRVQAVFNQWETGKSFTDEQREDIVDRSTKLYRKAHTAHEELRDSFRGIAETRGVDPSQYELDYVGDLAATLMTDEELREAAGQ